MEVIMIRNTINKLMILSLLVVAGNCFAALPDSNGMGGMIQKFANAQTIMNGGRVAAGLIATWNGTSLGLSTADFLGLPKLPRMICGLGGAYLGFSTSSYLDQKFEQLNNKIDGLAVNLKRVESNTETINANVLAASAQEMQNTSAIIAEQARATNHILVQLRANRLQVADYSSEQINLGTASLVAINPRSGGLAGLVSMPRMTQQSIFAITAGTLVAGVVLRDYFNK